MQAQKEFGWKKSLLRPIENLLAEHFIAAAAAA